jgi:hypothetical protein
MGLSISSSFLCRTLTSSAHVAELFKHRVGGLFEVVEEAFLSTVARVLVNGLVNPEGLSEDAVYGELSEVPLTVDFETDFLVNCVHEGDSEV